MNQALPQAVTGDLLARWTGDSPYFFATPDHAMLASGVRERISTSAASGTLLRDVDAALARARASGVARPIVVGAIPFAPDEPAALFVPEHVEWSAALPPRELARQPELSLALQQVPPARDYASGVTRAVQQLKDAVLDKVVLARTLEVSSPEAVDLRVLLGNLAARNASGYTFASQLTSGEMLLGASPELLLSRQGSAVRSHPLAGSIARQTTADDDLRVSAALLVSEKDLHEHRLVADAVESGLAPYCRQLNKPTRPALVSTAAMWHLASDIRGELLEPRASSLELALALHPTPAVCGHPTTTARSLIGEIEPFARGFYTGMVGWCDADGNGEWIVTIRCAKVSPDARQLKLYAGAGVVADSCPESETRETAAKFATMLMALGVVIEGGLA
ncbi:isochorismate synthase [Chitinibacteraceae bacterium HSL-7]